jgi:hypothetical protein
VSSPVLVAASGRHHVFGKKGWVGGTATIVAVNIVSVSSDGQTPTREFAADIVVPGVEPFRIKLGEPRWTADFWPPTAREQRGILRDPKSGDVRFDMKDPRNSFKHHDDAQASAFDAVLNEKPE